MKNKSFSIDEAFESLESIDFEKADRLIKESQTKIYTSKKTKKQVFLEALDNLREDAKKDEEVDNKPYTLNLNRNSDDDIRDAKEVFGEDDDTEGVEVITDVNAESADDLKKSYIGDEILQCKVCKKTYFKSPEEVVKAETEEDEEEAYNIEDECPHCGAKDGYNLIGQVAKKGTEEQKEEEVEDEVEKTKEPTKDEVEEEPIPEIEPTNEPTNEPTSEADKMDELIDRNRHPDERDYKLESLKEDKDCLNEKYDKEYSVEIPGFKRAFFSVRELKTYSNYTNYQRLWLNFVDEELVDHKGYGSESFINRPWHRFDFEHALYKAIHCPGLEEIATLYDDNKIAEKAGSVKDALERLAEVITKEYIPHHNIETTDVDTSEVEEESYQFDDEKFNEAINKHLNNHKKFKTSNVAFDDKNLVVEGRIIGPRSAKNVKFNFEKTRDNCYRGKCESLRDRFFLNTSINESKVFIVESIINPPIFEGKKNDERKALENELKNIFEGYDDSTINVIIKLYKLVKEDRKPTFEAIKNWIDEVGGLTNMLLNYCVEYKDTFTPKAIADIVAHDEKLSKILVDRAVEYYDYDDFELGDEIVKGEKFSEEPIEQLANELIDLEDDEVLEDTLKDLAIEYNKDEDDNVIKIRPNSKMVDYEKPDTSEVGEPSHPIQVGLQGRVNKLESLNEDESNNLIRFNNYDCKSWYDYAINVGGESPEEAEESGYPKDKYCEYSCTVEILNDKEWTKLCDLFYFNFDELPGWCEIGADNINSNCEIGLKHIGFIDDTQDIDCEMSYNNEDDGKEEFHYNESSTPEEIFRPFVEKFENVFRGVDTKDFKVESLKESEEDEERTKWVVVARKNDDDTLVDSFGVFYSQRSARQRRDEIKQENPYDDCYYDYEEVDTQGTFGNDEPEDADLYKESLNEGEETTTFKITLPNYVKKDEQKVIKVIDYFKGVFLKLGVTPSDADLFNEDTVYTIATSKLGELKSALKKATDYNHLPLQGVNIVTESLKEERGIDVNAAAQNYAKKCIEKDGISKDDSSYDKLFRKYMKEYEDKKLYLNPKYNKENAKYYNESKISSTIKEDEEDNKVEVEAPKIDSRVNFDTKIEEPKEVTLNLDKINLDSLNKLASKVHSDGTYVYGKDKTLKKEDLEYGYQVSFFRPEITDKDIKLCLSTIGDKLGPMYLGIWEGTPEISYCLDDLDKAKEVADCFNQEAIWDNAGGIAISVPRFDKDLVVDYRTACRNFNDITFDTDEDDYVDDIEGVVTTDIYDVRDKEESCHKKNESLKEGEVTIDKCPYCGSGNVDLVDCDDDSCKMICRDCNNDYVALDDDSVTNRHGRQIENQEESCMKEDFDDEKDYCKLDELDEDDSRVLQFFKDITKEEANTNEFLKYLKDEYDKVKDNLVGFGYSEYFNQEYTFVTLDNNKVKIVTSMSDKGDDYVNVTKYVNDKEVEELDLLNTEEVDVNLDSKELLNKEDKQEEYATYEDNEENSWIYHM